MSCFKGGAHDGETSWRDRLTEEERRKLQLSSWLDSDQSGMSNVDVNAKGLSGLLSKTLTMTTVGYGDFVPQTELGRLLAAVVMLLGFGIIAIPTGIVTVESIQQARLDRRVCSSCGHRDHRREASHCDQCGADLEVSAPMSAS